jgi:queuine tRNA-ribosyltransferase
MRTFEILAHDRATHARAGILHTKTGSIQTPFFFPIATRGAVKHIGANTLHELGAQAVLSNTYHLMLRPGSKLVKEMGGLHAFMNWDKPILTDSGGYQVFSLGELRKITGRGVTFRDDRTGDTHNLSPEKATRIQADLGVDMMMVLDECPAHTLSKQYIADSVDLTTRWAKRSRKEFFRLFARTPKAKRPLQFGIVQGGLYQDLREKSLRELAAINFEGYAIGGLAVGEANSDMYRILQHIVPQMPKQKPHYLMGVGKPENILEAVKQGIDMFDCVIPTRNARHGLLYTHMKMSTLAQIDYDIVRISNKKYKKMRQPIDVTCDARCCTDYSAAYIHHLFKVGEPLGQQLATMHNLRFYFKMMARIRELIKKSS